MKKSLLSLACLCFSLISCQNDSKDTEGASSASETQNVASESTQSDQTLEIIGTMNEESTFYLSNIQEGYWYVEHWLKIGDDDKSVYNANKGRWMKFEKNGSFTHGKLLQTVGAGKYTYNASSNMITMYANNPQYNAEFKIRMSDNGDGMSWSGAGRFQQNDIMAKLDKYVELMSEMPQAVY